MFEAYSNTSTSYSQNGVVTFPSVRFSDSRVTATTSAFTIKTPGRYMVVFNGVGSSGTAESAFTVQMYNNGTAVPGAISTITSTAANDESSLSIDSIIQVNPSCCIVSNATTITFVVTSSATGALSNATVSIIKLR